MLCWFFDNAGPFFGVFKIVYREVFFQLLEPEQKSRFARRRYNSVSVSGVHLTRQCLNRYWNGTGNVPDEAGQFTRDSSDNHVMVLALCNQPAVAVA